MVKYVQPNIICDDLVCLNYHCFTNGHEVDAELIEHMIRVLAYSTHKFHEIIDGGGNNE
ncbi:MAG: hypothetical protein ACI304_09695 [Lepagella sp.]